jgi:hypothetical protein
MKGKGIIVATLLIVALLATAMPVEAKPTIHSWENLRFSMKIKIL